MFSWWPLKFHEDIERSTVSHISRNANIECFAFDRIQSFVLLVWQITKGYGMTCLTVSHHKLNRITIIVIDSNSIMVVV